MSDIERRVEASSLGTPDAVAMRERTTPEQARRVIARSKEIAAVMAVADVIRAYFNTEDPDVSALLFNSEIEEVAERVYPVAGQHARADERRRVAAYLERTAAEYEVRRDPADPGPGGREAATLREAAGWCRDDTIWAEA